MKTELICKACIITAFILGVTGLGEPDKVVMVMLLALSIYIGGKLK